MNKKYLIIPVFFTIILLLIVILISTQNKETMNPISYNQSNQVENSDLIIARQAMIEELQAIDSYVTKIKGTTDPDLIKVLEYNMNDEKEHVSLLLDWIIKNDKVQSNNIIKNVKILGK